MTRTSSKWFTVAPLVETLTAWARRIIAGTDNDRVQAQPAPVQPTPRQEEEEIVIGPITGP